MVEPTLSHLRDIVISVLKSQDYKYENNNGDIFVGITVSLIGRFALIFKFAELGDRPFVTLKVRSITDDLKTYRIPADKLDNARAHIWRICNAPVYAGSVAIDPVDNEVAFTMRLSPHALTATPESALAEVNDAIHTSVGMFASALVYMRHSPGEALSGLLKDLVDGLKDESKKGEENE